MTHPFRVVLASDDPLLLERLGQEARPRRELVVSDFADPLASGEADAILVAADRLPGAEGMLRFKARGACVIGFGRREHLRAAFLAGCDDYLKDPWNLTELVCRLERLRSPAVGGTADPQLNVYRFPWGEVRLGELSLFSPTDRRSLSRSEYQILAALLRHRGQAVAREVLYYAIWGEARKGRSRAVDVHVSSLRRMLLELFPDSSGCLHSVRGTGYCLV